MPTRTARKRITPWRRPGDDGATAVEYGIMISLIALVIFATLILLGEELDSVAFRAYLTCMAAPATC